MMSLYLIILIILMVCAFVILLFVWFRILFTCESDRCYTSEFPDDNGTSRGHRNLCFDENEDLYSIRPFSISVQMDSPPSYEEALKYEQFGFHVSTPVYTQSPSTSASPSSSLRSDVSHQNVLSGHRKQPQLSNSPPRITEVRPRSSTVGSNSILAPIREEEIDESPVTVVIDCIGVQASRLMENCDTKIDISGGEELNGHSKC